mmetsp:Transcript_78739/g.218809  ORF Transcript_78739/g.218809 Transcript_78739/m.218809 type:complete len:227 (-) Transcript_78739:135-815(-)
MARHYRPLPPLDAPRGAQVAAVSAASGFAASSAMASSPTSPPSRSSFGLSLQRAPSSSSASASRPSTGGASSPIPMQAFDESRSTSASSHRSGAFADRAGDLFNTIVDAASQEPQETEIIKKAMLPIVRRAVVSSNKAVFQASLDSMRRIEQMFGQEAIDRHLEALVEMLETQCGKTGGDARAALIFETLTSLCSKDTAVGLRRRFPQYAMRQKVRSSASVTATSC